MSPRRLFLLLAALATALLLVACGSDDDGDGTVTDDPGGSEPADGSSEGDGGDATRPWIAGTWVLEAAADGSGPLTLPVGVPLELSIAGPDRIAGDAGCNTFTGRIDAPFDGDDSAGSLAITEMSWTEMACEHLDFEVTYLDLLGRVSAWELTPPSGLVFSGDDIELVYGIAEAGPELSLEGPTWVFDTIYEGEGIDRAASTPDLSRPSVTVTVADGVLTAMAEGCAPVEIAIGYEPGGRDGALTVEAPEALAALVDCEDPASNLVAAIDGVAAATGYQIVDGRLTLIGLPGETISFSAADG